MIGIRQEDKSRWEARVPLVPADLKRLLQDAHLKFQVQTSPIRAFADDEFRQAGAAVVTALRECPSILSVKEIPPPLLRKMCAEVLAVDGIAGVFYDLTHKPPGTIEWE